MYACILVLVFLLPGLGFWSVSPACCQMPGETLFVVSLEEWQCPLRRARRYRRPYSSGGRRRRGTLRRCLSRSKLLRRLRTLRLAVEPSAAQQQRSAQPPCRFRRVALGSKEVPPWALEEVQGLAFGDARLDYRLPRLLGQLAAQPTASIPQACDTWADTKAAYRFFDNEKVTPEKIRQAHQESCLERIKGQPLVLDSFSVIKSN